MAFYHCPHCGRILKRGPYPAWTVWVVGILFRHLFRSFICDEHGEIHAELLNQNEKTKIQIARAVALVVSIILSIVILILIFRYV